MLRAFPDTPKTRAKQWILAGRVQVRGQVMRKPQELLPDPGPGLELLDRRTTTLELGSGWRIHPRLTLLYLDPALAVVNKGAGLLSVPAPGTKLSAFSLLSDFLAGALRGQARALAGRTLPAAYRRLQVFPVHRLDQYTSGVFCLACNPGARERLISQLRAHTMSRQYVAFVEGRPPTPKGTWRDWLELSDDELRPHLLSNPRPKAPQSKVREAITHFEVLAEYPLLEGSRFVTKLQLRLQTGLKHQIRIQAAHAGLPLLGDRSYHPSYRPDSTRAKLVDFPRQALHAQTLSLEHPDQPGQRMSWTAALPDDLRELEAGLRAGRR